MDRRKTPQDAGLTTPPNRGKSVTPPIFNRGKSVTPPIFSRETSGGRQKRVKQCPKSLTNSGERQKRVKQCSKSLTNKSKFAKLDMITFQEKRPLHRFRKAALAIRFQTALHLTSKEYSKFIDIEDANYAKEKLLKIREVTKGKFKKVVEMILVLIKVIKVFSAHASATGRPVLIGQLHDLKEEIPQHPAFFQPKRFALTKFQYHMEPEARRILQLPWVTRTPEHIERVRRALRHCKGYREMTQAMQFIVAKYARYESHEKNRTIVRKGDAGRHYYFIFSGEVLCMNSDVPNQDSTVVLGPGADFGHVAILHMEKRQATIMCSEDTEFVVLDRRGNERAVFRALHREHKMKRQFLATVDVFKGLELKDHRALADHARITEYLPMSLIVTVSPGHNNLYIIVEGTANVALKTDLYSCCTADEIEIKHYLNQKYRHCAHKNDVLHDIFTHHDPTITCVIQRLTERQIFGVQHTFHKNTASHLPTLHLIAKSKVMVITIPVFIVLHYADSISLSVLQDRYPVYPSMKELMCEYMETSIWDLYKAHIIRDLLHPEGRVDPRKRCKYCIACQLRSLMLPNILYDEMREDVADLYCPGYVSPLPALAREVFRPQSAPPHYSKVTRGPFRSLNPTPNLKTPDPTLRNPTPNRKTPDPTLRESPDLHLPKVESKETFPAASNKATSHFPSANNKATSRYPSASNKGTSRNLSCKTNVIYEAVPLL